MFKFILRDYSSCFYCSKNKKKPSMMPAVIVYWYFLSEVLFLFLQGWIYDMVNHHRLFSLRRSLTVVVSCLKYSCSLHLLLTCLETSVSFSRTYRRHSLLTGCVSVCVCEDFLPFISVPLPPPTHTHTVLIEVAFWTDD